MARSDDDLAHPGAPAAPPTLPALPPDAAAVLRALALGATHRAPAWLAEVLDALDGAPAAPGTGRRTEPVAQALRLLTERGLAEPHPYRAGIWRVAPWIHTAACLALHEHAPFEALAGALAAADGWRVAPFGPQGGVFPSLDAACAMARLAAFGGRPEAEMARLRSRVAWGTEWEAVIERAVHDVLDATLFGRLDPALQVEVLRAQLEVTVAQARSPGELPAARLALELLRRATPDPGQPAAPRDRLASGGLPEVAAQALALAGRFDDADDALAPLPTEARRAQADALRGLRAFREGDFAASAEAYEAALRPLRAATGRRKALLPPTIALPHALALMALGQAEPGRLQEALRLCLAEGGSRQPAPGSPWGVLARAIRMRLGEEPRDPRPFVPATVPPASVQPLDLWRWMARVWLHDGPGADPRCGPADQAAARLLRATLVQAGLTELAGLLDGALQVLTGQPAPPGFFAPGRDGGWRSTLDALAALARPARADAPAPASTDTQAVRRLWQLSVNAHGALLDVIALEQRAGVRGWGAARPVPLQRLARLDPAELAPQDAAVLRALRTAPRDRAPRLDRVAAAEALIGHPHLAFDDAPDLPVRLEAGSPELDVDDLGGHFRVTLVPPPRWADPAAARDEPRVAATDAAGQREAEALAATTVLRDAPDRARLVRLDAAQTRVAQLIGAGLDVPREGAGALDEVLHALGASLRLATRAPRPDREVDAPPRLRAELTPEGDGLALRLVVAPLGADGPRYDPGLGRGRPVVAHGGETLALRRDLAAERDRVDTVLGACPMLEPLPAGAPSCWTLARPDAALALLARLHDLQAVEALDWPSGRPIRIEAAGSAQLRVNVRSGQSWLTLAGGVEVDGRLVASLGRLLDGARRQAGRYLPIGEGRYLALTEELARRLEALAAVADPLRGDDARVPAAALAWLDTTMRGADLRPDLAFRERVDRLAAHAPDTPAPPGLQARLRPYQLDGYHWAMRRAALGFGAILADDMGLGKTVQALAVLLARAAQGPALVVAPTSLRGNWQAEAARFAPSLRLVDHAEADPRDPVAARRARLAGLGPGDVAVVSYPMLQIDADAFAARPWGTLVLDEAQAVKNAGARRSRAVHRLQAGFRLALSGTPVENRLAELWSLMRVCNPGLLGSEAVFRLRFAIPIERDRHEGARRTLQRLVAPFMLRRTRAQVLAELPPRTEIVRPVQPDAVERAYHEALRRQALRESEEALRATRPGQARMNILAQLTRLRRAACDPRLVTPGLGQPGAKVQAFAALARDLAANGHRTLVFSQFVDFLHLLRDALDAEGLSHQYLDGSTPAAERTRRVAAFQSGEGAFFLISLKAGGTGLNLTGADDVILADPWWNPAVEDQASGRAHRLGQTRPVTVHRLVSLGTLEERIMALHQDKRDLAEGVLAGDEPSGLPPAEVLMALLQGEEPARADPS